MRAIRRDLKAWSCLNEAVRECIERKLPVEPVYGSSEIGSCLFPRPPIRPTLYLYHSVTHDSKFILHHKKITGDPTFLSQSKAALGPVGAVEERSSVGPYSGQRSTVLSSCNP